MTPEALLELLIQTRAQLPNALDTPFLLHRSERNDLFLSHPMLPDDGIFVGSDMKAALDELVRWGYLTQITQDQGTGYLLTLGGLRYAAHETEPPWDGTERRRGRRAPYGVEPRVKPTKLKIGRTDNSLGNSNSSRAQTYSSIMRGSTE